MMTKKLDVAKHLINKMFEFANLEVTYDDIVGREDDWYSQYTMTQEQHNKWKEYSIPYIKKYMKVPMKYAETSFAWFNLSYGLKIEQPKAQDIDNIN